MLNASSLKAALDVDWDEPACRAWAVGQVLAVLQKVEAYVPGQPTGAGPERAQAVLAVTNQVRVQNVAQDEKGQPHLRLAWRGTGVSASKMGRCAMAARPPAG